MCRHFPPRFSTPWRQNTAASGLFFNGQKLDQQVTPGTFLALKRVWQDGDTLKLELPMSLRTHHAADDPEVVSFFYGPVLLAGELGRENYPGSDHVKDQLALAKLLVPPIPTLIGIDSDRPSEWLHPVPGKPLVFSSGTATEPAHILFSPLYGIHHQRYAVYWKVAPSGRVSLSESNPTIPTHP